jgi:phosphatidylserine/phosphatidylglycerophosphate/cardiolipin synthase-like enzyme
MAARIAIAVVVIGVFLTWTTDEPVTLNGTQGPNNGWLAVIVAGFALGWTWPLRRSSWIGIAGVLGAAVVIAWTALENWLDNRDVLGASAAYGLVLVVVASVVLAGTAVATVVQRAGDADTRAAGGRGRKALAIAALVLALVFVLVYRETLLITQRRSWPPPPEAVTSAGAQAATEAFAASDGPRPHDAALDFAWSTAVSIEPRVEGASFFPRILADIEAARSSVHILMFGWREGEIGMQMAELLERKLGEGVEVRVIVDRYGSRPYGDAREMFTGLAAAGAQIVVNDVFPIDRDGLFPDDQHLDWRQDEVGRADHRKLYVIDGAVAWTGGAGIEDHFRDGGFHDVMTRVTGDVVRQAQAAFLTSFRGHDAPLQGDLSKYFPEPADPGTTPIALAQVIPEGFVAATQAIREQIDAARTRLDVMNAYFTDREMIERIIAAARRGVRVRVVLSEESNNPPAEAAARHRYADLIAAGVELWELPGTVVHAKVIVADDVVSFGTVNLDAWALYRDSEIMMIARSAELAKAFEERLFEPDIARSRPGEPPEGLRERLGSWLWDKLGYFL